MRWRWSARAAAGELAGRLLGQRERARAGALLALTAADVLDKLDSGERLRGDDFFDDVPGDRSTAKEVAEGVLMAAQRDYEERKLPRYAALLANLCMLDAQTSGIDRAMANVLVSVARTLSYQQLCILEALHKRREALPANDDTKHAIRETAGATASVVVSASQLLSVGVVSLPPLVSFKPYFNFLTAELAPIGKQLCSLMELEKLNGDDVRAVETLLLIPSPALSQDEAG
jgi:hypothetical protein